MHCKGGLGRSGTIAARLLVELGEAPRVAIDRVRKARPFALEAPAQERHVHGCRGVTDAGNVLGAASRVLGCLIGGAVGDAFGYAVEFDSLAAIHAHFGEAGITEPVIERGGLAVSDDTQMTLFTLDGLLAGWRAGEAPMSESRVAEIRRAYLDWLAAQGEGAPTPGTPGRWLAAEQALQARRAPGNTCLSALRAGGRGTLERPANDSKGCGGVMRVAPLGQGWVGEEALAVGLYAALVARSFEEAVRIAANHDGDSDSTASIAGQLHGAWKGVGAVPHRWARHIDVLLPLLRLARALLTRHHAGA